MNLPIKPQRIDYLDIAKGIGILFVVLGHNHIKLDYPVIYQVIYSFHMPFFFLLSGLFFNPNYSLFELVRKRFNSLLKPFIVYMVVVYSASMLFSKIDLPTIFSRIVKSLYAGPNTLDWVPLWFLPHLFLVNLLAFVLVKLAYDRLAWLWLRLILLAGMLWLGTVTIRRFWPVTYPIPGHPLQFFGLPWSADLLLITTPFFLFGYELRRTVLEKPERVRHLGWGALVGLVLFVGLHIFYDTTIDFYIRVYGPVIVSTLEALSGSLMILWLAQFLQQKGPAPLANGLKYLGLASVVLLIFHYVPQEFLYPKLIALNIPGLAASLISFCAGLGFPLLLYAWVIRPNKWLASWFGMN